MIKQIKAIKGIALYAIPFVVINSSLFVCQCRQ